MKTTLLFFILLLSGSLPAQPPVSGARCISDGWTFAKMQGNNYQQAQPVQLPHSWNIEDVMDEVPGYFRGVGSYRKEIFIEEVWKGKQITLYFEAANQYTEVFINGKKAGSHTGGYTGFSIPVNDFVNFGLKNLVEVKVDNSYNQDIAPLSADFTFYGGIYRDVWLCVQEEVHITNERYGNRLYRITTPVVTNDKASVKINYALDNFSRAKKHLQVNTFLLDAKNNSLAKHSISVQLNALGKSQQVKQDLSISTPRLWSPEDPYLYRVVTVIKDSKTGRTLDSISTPYGFRWFSFSPDQGFTLNGRSVKLVGTSRHQDFPGKGNALRDEIAINDIVLLKKMGGNFLRIAHYPQDQSVLNACDSLGIITSVEIPLVNEISETERFAKNCLDMQTEMIRQNFNHTSVIIWCSMNEILLRPHYKNDKVRQQQYISAIGKLARSLDSLSRMEDPSRYTMMAHHGDYEKYRSAGLIDIPQITGWNLYAGWYGNDIRNFPEFLDSFHAKHPDKPMLVSEFGADADPRIRSTEPVRFDKSIEYALKFHQYYFREMSTRPFVAAAMIWNLADFNSETRTETMPHINNKGLLSWDRKPKDIYYYYKAMLVKEPFITMLGDKSGTGAADGKSTGCKRTISAATNLDSISFFVNNKYVERVATRDGIAQTTVHFTNGINMIRASDDGKKVNDSLLVNFNLIPAQFNPGENFSSLQILMGAQRYFTDDQNGIWIPAQAYSPHSWGFTGGKYFKINGNNRLPYGTDKNIINTSNDPIYQTQQVGIREFRLDVPDGEYEVTLHFAELLGGQLQEIPYNLSDEEKIEPNGKRIFNVLINGSLMLDNFDIAAQYGIVTAVSRTFKVTAQNAGGIGISFVPIEGEPVLNALQVKRIRPIANSVNQLGD